MNALAKIDLSYTGTVCGSYRRGAPSSGDIDVLLNHSNISSTSKISVNRIV